MMMKTTVRSVPDGSDNKSEKTCQRNYAATSTSACNSHGGKLSTIFRYSLYIIKSIENNAGLPLTHLHRSTWWDIRLTYWEHGTLLKITDPDFKIFQTLPSTVSPGRVLLFVFLHCLDSLTEMSIRTYL